MASGTDRTPIYSVIQGLYWALFGAVIGYAPVFLLDQGLSATSLGFLVALANTAGTILQPIVASIADRWRRITLSHLVSLFSLATVVFGVLLVTWSDGIMALLYVALIALTWILMPLVNAVGMYFNRSGMSCNYGIARAMGSLAFAGLSFFMGWYIPSFGASRIPLVAAALAFFLAVLLFFVRTPAFAMEESEAGEDSLGAAPANFFARYPGFLSVLFGVFLIFSFHNLSNTYLIQMIRHVGGGEPDLAFTLGLAALLELPAMILFSRFEKRLGAATVMKIAAIFWVFKSLAYLAAGQVGHIYGTQLLHGAAFAPFMPAIVYYSDQTMRQRDRVKGQAMMTTANSLGGILGNTSGGILIDQAGVPAMLWAGALLAITGAGALFAGLARQKRKKPGKAT